MQKRVFLLSQQGAAPRPAPPPPKQLDTQGRLIFPPRTPTPHTNKYFVVPHTARRPLQLTLGQLLHPAQQPAGGQGAVDILVRQAEYGTTASAVEVAGAEAASGGGWEAAAAAAPGDGGGSGGHERGGSGCCMCHVALAAAQAAQCVLQPCDGQHHSVCGMGVHGSNGGQMGSGGVVGVQAEIETRGGARCNTWRPLGAAVSMASGCCSNPSSTNTPDLVIYRLPAGT